MDEGGEQVVVAFGEVGRQEVKQHPEQVRGHGREERAVEFGEEDVAQTLLGHSLEHATRTAQHSLQLLQHQGQVLLQARSVFLEEQAVEQKGLDTLHPLGRTRQTEQDCLFYQGQRLL